MTLYEMTLTNARLVAWGHWTMHFVAEVELHVSIRQSSTARVCLTTSLIASIKQC